MILGLQQKIKDGVKGIVDYYFDVLPTKEQYAKVEERPYEWLALYLNEDKYEFIGKLKMIERVQAEFMYPYSNNWTRTPGLSIEKNGDLFADTYSEAMKVGKVNLFGHELPFKRNVLSTVYKLPDGHFYMLFKVGFPKKNSYYMCIYNEKQELISIIERRAYYNDNYRAILYIEDDEYIPITIIIASREICLIPGGSMNGTDTSAPPYVSRYEEEKVLFKQDFLDRVIEKNKKEYPGK